MFIKILNILVMAGLLTACSSQTEPKMIKEVENVVVSTFEQEKPKPNETNKGYQYKQPFGIKEKSSSKNNIILEKRDQLFTLFYDPKSDDKTHLYDEEKMEDKDPLMFKELENEKLTFIKVVKLDENQYELTLGRGGVKITTITNSSKIDNDAEMMAEITYSFEFK